MERYSMFLGRKNQYFENDYPTKSEKAMAPHSSTLAWKITWTEEPGRLQSMGSLRVGYHWATSLSLFTFHFHALEKEMATHSSVLAWRIPGTGEPIGLPSMGSHRVRHDWSDLAAYYQMQSTDSIWSLSNYHWHFLQNRKFHNSYGNTKDPE